MIDDDDDNNDEERSSVYICSHSGEENELKLASKNKIRAKKKFSTETGFEQSKNSENSKGNRLIIIKNASERWGMPFWSSISNKRTISSTEIKIERKSFANRREVR